MCEEVQVALRDVEGPFFDDTDRELADTISRYWVQFALTGDPNRNDLPAWPPYDTQRDLYLELGDEIKAARSPDREFLDLFAGISAETHAKRKEPSLR